MENLGLLTPLITLIVTLVIFMLLELIPILRPWWDKVTPEKKRSYRGFLGLIVTAVLGLLHYLNVYDLQLGPIINPDGILILLVSWVLMVQGGETLYQTFREILPRKIAERKAAAKAAGK